jgi:subtilisin-like proprotein convertase family protein
MKIYFKFIVLFLMFTSYTSIAQTFTTPINDSLPDPGFVTFNVNVSGLPSTIDTFFGLQAVCINLDHTYCADIKLRLISPDGTSVPVFGNIGGGDDNFYTCIDGTAALPISSTSAPFTGSWRSGKLYLANNGQNPNGNWGFEFEDNYGADKGFLIDISLTFSSTPSKPPTPFTSSNLPIVKINTNGTGITDDPKVLADFNIINNNTGARNYFSDTVYEYSGTIMVEHQGFSSPGNPKKNFDFNFINPAGATLDTSLLGMPADNDWVLKAEWTDNSLINNPLTYQLAQAMQNYAPRTRWCEVMVDGEYVGVYNLTEQIKRGKNRVDIKKMLPTDVSGAALTGGYMIEMNINGDAGAWYSAYPPANIATTTLEVEFKHVYPKASNINPTQVAYIKAYVDSFEQRLNAIDYTDPTTGWRAFGSSKSFIDFLLVNELSMNYDSYGRSTFMYKDEGKKLHIGPSWDYDRAFANDPTEGWVWEIMHPLWPFPNWWQRMYDDTLFRHELSCRYKSLRNDVWHIDTINQKIDDIKLKVTEAMQRNLDTWPEMGVSDTLVWWDILQSRKDFIANRLAWMDATLNTSAYSLPSMPVLAPTYCSGQPIDIYSGVGYTYNFITGPDTSLFVPTQAGVHIAEVSDAFGCYSRKRFEVLPNNIATFTSSSTGVLQFQFVPIDATAVSYLWDFGDGTSATSTSPTHTFTSNAIYQVQLTTTNANGCTASYLVQLNTITGINESGVNWKIYPNPTADILHIESISQKPTTALLFDASGKLVIRETTNNGSIDVNVKTLANGAYTLMLSSDGQNLGAYNVVIDHK